MENRAYKDSVFVDLFLHDANATDNFTSLVRALCRFLKICFQFEMSDLKPVELDSSLYSGGRTDVLYNIKDELLVFIEHQSTINPNMAVRLLEYFVETLKRLGYEKAKYGNTPIKIPTPVFIVLYNGEKDAPNVQTSKLSDLIEYKAGMDFSIDLNVVTININYEHNMSLLNDCPILKEYAMFIAEVRKQKALHSKDGFAIAIDNCIKNGVLSEYLTKNRRRVMSIFMGEYDQEIALQVAREESYEMGLEKGIAQGITQGITQGISQGISQGINQGINQEKTALARMFRDLDVPIEKIMKATGFTEREILSL